MKNKKDEGKKTIKKKLFIIIGGVVLLAAIIGLVIYINVKIPSKYIGVFTRNYYYDGCETKETYTINSLSIEHYWEFCIRGEITENVDKLEYYEKDGDLIIKDGDKEEYAIIDDGHLYVQSNKDIESAKKYKTYYWNEKGKDSTEEELYNKSEVIESQIEETVMQWARKEIHKDETFKYDFYILDSDEEPDKTDLNEYKVKKKVSNGDLTFTFDKKTKKLKYIDFYGSLLVTSYNDSYNDLMTAEDIYDVESMIASLIYIFEDKSDADSYTDPVEGMKAAASVRYYMLLMNKTKDSKYSNGYRYELDNDDYKVSYDKLIDSSNYLISGLISFRFEIKK